MTPAMLAILLRPIIVAAFFFLVVAPIAWTLYRLFPPGRLKVLLFKDRTGKEATSEDKKVMTMAAIAGYTVVILVIGIVTDLCGRGVL